MRYRDFNAMLFSVEVRIAILIRLHEIYNAGKRKDPRLVRSFYDDWLQECGFIHGSSSS